MAIKVYQREERTNVKQARKERRTQTRTLELKNMAKDFLFEIAKITLQKADIF